VTEKKRDHLVHYVRCPEHSGHFILADPTDPTWEKTPPKSPLTIECRGCGPHHRVKVAQPWKTGYVSLDEREQLVAYLCPVPQCDRRYNGSLASLGISPRLRSGQAHAGSRCAHAR